MRVILPGRAAVDNPVDNSRDFAKNRNAHRRLPATVQIAVGQKSVQKQIIARNSGKQSVFSACHFHRRASSGFVDNTTRMPPCPPAAFIPKKCGQRDRQRRVEPCVDCGYSHPPKVSDKARRRRQYAVVRRGDATQYEAFGGWAITVKGAHEAAIMPPLSTSPEPPHA